MLADMAAPNKRVTVGADKAYDTKVSVKACRNVHVTQHVAQNTTRLGDSVIEAHTTRHAAYELIQCKRKRVKQYFGWGKVIGRGAPGHSPRPGQGRSVDDADHGRLRPQALAHLDTGAFVIRLRSDECVAITPCDSKKTLLGTASGPSDQFSRPHDDTEPISKVRRQVYRRYISGLLGLLNAEMR